MNFVQKIFASMQGRTTTFLILFFVTGLVLQVMGKLTLVYVSFFTAFMAAVIGHSVKEDLLSTGAQAPPAPEEKP